MKVYKFGDNINTDVIIPARFCTTVSGKELARHCMHDVRPGFHDEVNGSGIIVAGRNFGCGSSREAAPLSIKECGIQCVIAASFSRIFFRNSINIGLPLFEHADINRLVSDGDDADVLFDSPVMRLKNGREIQLSQFRDQVINEIVAEGGLVSYIQKRRAI